jgi:hypothetical protein
MAFFGRTPLEIPRRIGASAKIFEHLPRHDECVNVVVCKSNVVNPSYHYMNVRAIDAYAYEYCIRSMIWL